MATTNGQRWLYVRGVHEFMYDKMFSTDGLSKFRFMIGITDDIKRGFRYIGDDNGMYYFALQLDTEEEILMLMKFLAERFSNVTHGKCLDLDVFALSKRYQLKSPVNDKDKYRCLAKIVFTEILLEVHKRLDKYIDNMGYEIQITEKETLDGIFRQRYSPSLKTIQQTVRKLAAEEVEEIKYYLTRMM